MSLYPPLYAQVPRKEARPHTSKSMRLNPGLRKRTSAPQGVYVGTMPVNGLEPVSARVDFDEALRKEVGYHKTAYHTNFKSSVL